MQSIKKFPITCSNLYKIKAIIKLIIQTIIFSNIVIICIYLSLYPSIFRTPNSVADIYVLFTLVATNINIKITNEETDRKNAIFLIICNVSILRFVVDIKFVSSIPTSLSLEASICILVFFKIPSSVNLYYIHIIF